MPTEIISEARGGARNFSKKVLRLVSLDPQEISAEDKAQVLENLDINPSGEGAAAASQGEVNAGVVTDKYVSPKTLADKPGSGGDMLATNNLDDLDDAAEAFDNIKQAATTSATGVVELATDGETSAGVVVQGNDSRLVAQTNITGNAGTVTTNANLTGPVTSTGNATAIADGAISNAMLANGAVANLSGTNTGDNATNTQYSGLVSNATHTGDATGATALTLATVNGNVGSFTNASVTVNAKGLVTAASNGTAPYVPGGTDVAIADGGTGRSTGTTAYALVATGTTATGAQQTLASGATTTILVGGGASALPVWTTATGTGAPVRAGSPSLTTPTIAGAALSGTITGSPTFTGTPAMNGGMTGTKTFTSGIGVAIANDFAYNGTPGAGDYPFGLQASILLNGSTHVTGGEHGVGGVGHASDGANNEHNLIGIEGKVEGTGKGSSYIGTAGDATYQGTTFTGKSLYGFSVTNLKITTNGSTPLNEGSAFGLYVPPITGGATKWSVLGGDAIGVHNASDGSKITSLTHDGTNGNVLTTAGNLNLQPAAGAAYVIVSAAGMIPAAPGVALGLAGVSEFAIAATTLSMKPGASVTPANNGEITFQFTSNTQVTIKGKGSDSTVRSVNLTLA